MRVLFVSKPVVPPWNDGSKNLVRDVAMNLKNAEPTVMVSPGAPPLGGRVHEEPVYGERGSFAPTLTANSRVLARLMLGDPLDAWHFVFAPNRASSTAAWLAKSSRRSRGWQGKVVQTVASAPRSFRGVRSLLFGDVVVAQSEHTRGRLVGAGVRAADVRVILPCAKAPRTRDKVEIDVALERMDLPKNGPIVLYPGDVEVGTGAQTVARAARALIAKVPEVTIVMACRKKTPRAAGAELELKRIVEDLGDRVRFVGDVPDMHALLCASAAIAMPADDLYGKVDVPLVVIEALALGKPLLLARFGPLESVQTARFVDPGDSAQLATELVRILASGPDVVSDAKAGVRLYEEHFSPIVAARSYDELYESG
jgi:glycosyltransferase involved in cell wall biosynthesis